MRRTAPRQRDTTPGPPSPFNPAHLPCRRPAASAHASANGASASANGGSGAGSVDTFWERQLQLKLEQVAQLQAQLDAASRASGEAAVRHEAALAALQNQLTLSSLSVERLEKEVARRPEPREFQVALAKKSRDGHAA